MNFQPPSTIVSERNRFDSREILMVLGMLFLAVFVRLIMIDQPFVDHWSWRQSLLAMVAENYYLHGFNIMYPQVNMAGSAPGYVGMEFPLVPFIAALLYRVFGVREWVARLVPVVFFAMSLPFFYLLVKKIFNRRSAFFAIAIYSLVPLSIFASRSFISDMPTLSLSIVAIYLFSEWLDRERDWKLFVSTALVTALAILVKLPSIIIGLPFLYMVWHRYGMRFILRLRFWGFAAASLIPSTLWYLHAYFISITEFPHELWGFQRLKLVTAEQFLQAVGSTVNLGLTPIVSGAAVLGAVFLSQRNYRYVFHWWLLAVAIFWFFAGEGFVMHAWYGLIVVPATAAQAGHGFDLATNKFENFTGSRTASMLFILILFSFVGYSSYIYVQPKYEPWANAYQKAGLVLKNISSPEALVVFAGVGDPTGIYYSKRGGCNFYAPADSQDAIETLVGLRSEGVRYLAITHHAFWWLKSYKGLSAHLYSEHKQLTKNSEYVIFELAPVRFPSITKFDEMANTRRNGSQEPTHARQLCGCTAFGFECFQTSSERKCGWFAGTLR